MIIVENKIKALIFDCDGTLVDSMPLQFEVWRETFEAFGRTYPHEFVDSRKGLSVMEVLRQYNAYYNDNINLREFTEIREKKALERLRTVKGIVPVLEVVNQYKNILPMAVCSGSTKSSVMTSLKAVSLTGYFKVILTADDGLPPKPAPDIFLEAAQRLNIAPAYCQVFEDGDSGIEAAHKAGMIVTDIRKYL